MKYKSDQENWIKQLSTGNEEAYRFFFDEYYQMFCSFAMKYVGEPEVAEDIINDIIFDMYSSKKIFPDIVALKSFLFTSIKNRSLNYIRHRKAQARYLQDPEGTNTTEYFLEAIIEEEVYCYMHKAIMKLPLKIREIYKLSLAGESNESIASQLHLTLDSVKAYKKRGKQILKDSLQDWLVCLSIIITKLNDKKELRSPHG